jgi:hypothetical protein
MSAEQHFAAISSEEPCNPVPKVAWSDQFDRPAILLPHLICSPAPVLIFRKVSPTCQSAASSLHFDSSMQRTMREEYFRGELEL